MKSLAKQNEVLILQASVPTEGSIKALGSVEARYGPKMARCALWRSCSCKKRMFQWRQDVSSKCCWNASSSSEGFANNIDSEQRSWFSVALKYWLIRIIRYHWHRFNRKVAHSPINPCKTSKDCHIQHVSKFLSQMPKFPVFVSKGISATDLSRFLKHSCSFNSPFQFLCLKASQRQICQGFSSTVSTVLSSFCV